MPLIRPENPNRRVAGFNTLGPIERSLGYLQGGYYTGAVPGNRNSGNPAGDTYPPDGVVRGAEDAWSWVQGFNCITGIGKLIMDTGANRRYYAGITGNHAGYYSSNNNYDYQKFSYFTTTPAFIFTISQSNNSSAVDLEIYSTAWIFNNSTGEQIDTGVSDYISVNLSTDTPTDRGNLGSGAWVTSRQQGNNQYAAFMYVSGDIYSLNYSNYSVASQGGFAALEQIVCAMPVTDAYGYYVGYSNYKANFSGASMTSYSQSTSYTWNFGESHSLTNNTFGFMMAGYPDNSGRYNSVQHGLCERLTLATEAHTIQNDTVLPQSSGQMMQGF